MGRGPENQSRPNGPTMAVPRAAWASSPRMAVGDAPAPHHRLWQPARGASIGRRWTGHETIAPGGSRRQPGRPGGGRASPPAPATTRPLAHRSVPPFAAAAEGWYQSAFQGAVRCHPASMRRAALRAGRRRRRSTAPCLLRFDCRTSVAPRRRILNGCPSLRRRAHGGGRCTRWRLRSAAAALRLACRCLRPASGALAWLRSRSYDNAETPRPRDPAPFGPRRAPPRPYLGPANR